MTERARISISQKLQSVAAHVGRVGSSLIENGKTRAEAEALLISIVKASLADTARVQKLVTKFFAKERREQEKRTKEMYDALNLPELNPATDIISE